MLRVVIDTSSLISYVLTQGEIMGQVVAHWRANAFRLVSSPDTRAELSAVLHRPEIRRMAAAPLDELTVGLERFSHHVPGDLALSTPRRDPKYVKFLLCAIEGEAHYLVGSDRDLLDLRRYRGVAIVNPGQFLLALELHTMDEAAMVERFGQKVLQEILESIPLEPETAGWVRSAVALLESS